MKYNRIIWAIALMWTVSLHLAAQNIVKDEPVIVYAMPKTILHFELEFEKTTQEVGIFYQYSERYLGTTDVVTANKTAYELKAIKLQTETVADENRKYKIYPNKNLLTSYVVLNEQGILCAINDSYVPAPMPCKQKKCVQTTTPQLTLMPLGEEQMQANSTAKMAEGTAKQIYRIRESRMNLLAGDVDALPADGQSMETILRELANTEQTLCELFVGKRCTETLYKSIEYTPTDNLENFVLCRFSAQDGIVSANDLGGAPVYINIATTKQEYAEQTDEKQKSIPALYYNLPGTAHITIVYNKQQMIDQNLCIPQFGLSVPLPNELFQKSNVKIQFDPQTGTLLKISK